MIAAEIILTAYRMKTEDIVTQGNRSVLQGKIPAKTKITQKYAEVMELGERQYSVPQGATKALEDALPGHRQLPHPPLPAHTALP